MSPFSASRLPLLLVLSLLPSSLHRGNLCSATGNPAFRSIRAPADLIKDYEVHVPAVTRALTDQHDYPQQLVVQVSHFKFFLDLNSDLIHPRFSSHHFDNSGNEVIEKGHVNCFYHGMVEGHDDWQVTMSTCLGLQGSFGRMDSDEFYHIEPLDQTNPELEQTHALYLNSQYSHRNGTCGTSSRHKPVPGVDVSHDGVWLNQHKLHRRQVNGFFITEWAIINDYAQYTDFGRNLSAVVMRNLEIANLVDMNYRPLNIRVVVVDVITWTKENLIQYPADNNSNAILDALAAYTPQITAERDSLMLMTGVNLRGSVVGLAYVGTMCNNRFSVGLTQDRRASVAGVASTASHELGHIFNMDHDDGRQCTCSDPVGTCIMAGVSTAGIHSTQWSSCSRADLNTGFTESNLNRCLNNEPVLTVGDPSCGNGIRENNEVCDCGSVEECTDPCCNATSCTLREGAQCSEGPCCSDNCQFLSVGTTCRAATQECDIMEYCSGSSSDCPRDLYKQDGSPCNQSLEFCFTGVCPSLDAQCQRFFQTEKGVPECYTQLNIAGSQSGNCGARDGQYVACAPEHAQCGQLMCDGGRFQFNELPGLSVRANAETVTSDSVTQTCSSFTLPPAADTVSPGLVPDGTRCGNESVCVTQSCVELSTLTYIQACPVGGNGQTCSGNGICNNLNQCSCNVGFTSSNCGSGTSAGSSTGAIVGAVLGTIVGLILAGVVIAVIIIVVIKYRSKKQSVPLTARSRPTVSKLGNESLTGSQDNLLDNSSRETVSVHVTRPSRGYHPPPLHGSPAPAPERAPTGHLHNANKPPKPAPPTSRVAPEVHRNAPNSGSSSYLPKASGRESPSLQFHSKPKPPPPSRAMPPPPQHKGGVSSAPPRSGLPQPSSKVGMPKAPSRVAPPVASSRAAAPSPSYLKGRPPSPDQARAPLAKPPPYGPKQSKVQKQWPPPGGSVSPSTHDKAILPAKKPMAPPRR